MEIRERTAKDKKAIGKQLWQILRALYCRLHGSISKHTALFMADLHLRRLFAFHGLLGSLSCRSVDPTKAYYSPREVEFSCSNTPPYTCNHRRRDRKRGLEADDIARAFEILNSEPMMTQGEEDRGFASATPSPVEVWRSATSPAMVRQLRVTDSPFPIIEEEGGGGGGGGGNQVDREAEGFIKRFYEQLRLQRIG